MRSAKSINSLANQQPTNQSTNNNNNASSPTSPICRCRVTYLGSSVPHITKDGLQGIQEPLRELYPDKAALGAGNAGIDSWLSVWSNGILIENVDETGREVKRFFKIDALHYCAAVKFVPMPLNQQQLHNPYTTLPNGNLAAIPKFLPLDSPHARQANNNNPPIFASILRRTSGIKVLECHAFICKREAAANALVRCCFHAYADTMYAKQIGADINGTVSNSSINNNNDINNDRPSLDGQGEFGHQPPIVSRRSKSIAALNDAVDARSDTKGSNNVHARSSDHHDGGSMMRRNSMNEHYAFNCDISADQQQQQFNTNSNNLRKQQKLSKSMHQLNPNGQIVDMTMHSQTMKEQQVTTIDYDASSASCINLPNGRWAQVPHHPPFYNPYASRVPSYPPQNIIDATSNGGTIKSIRSLATNSIASTLLRSKKHAKAMSVAQEKITSFHQPHSNSTMPPVPPMFLPNMPAHTILNGSQTMKIPNRPMIPIVGPHMNFEAMTPKEMKKLLKKGAKYGIDPNKFGENGLPLLPLRPPPQPLMSQSCHIPQPSKSGTIISQSKSVYSEVYSSDMPIHEQLQIKPILVKPNPEFLKSKAGKKWLKQQKEFKKLLPPHLDGLPIVFGPPPIEALEPATVPNNNIQPMAFLPPHPGIPMMDSSGFYNPNPFYGQNGRASAASTLLRYSPHPQIMHENSNGISSLNHNGNYLQANNIIFNNSMPLSPTAMMQRQSDYPGDESSMIFGGQECPGLRDRPFVDIGNRHYQKRNHMVEQSVISLGDENDFEDEDEEEAETDGVSVQQNDYYSASNHESDSNSNSRMVKHQMIPRDRNHEHSYDQVMQTADEQGSYSSGIYRRGHINERAFSYSIRQEHKSSGNSDVEQECHMNHHDNQQHHHTRNMFQGNNDSQSIPVNELTARLENQLNMKSFSNSRIKSHI